MEPVHLGLRTSLLWLVEAVQSLVTISSENSWYSAKHKLLSSLHLRIKRIQSWALLINKSVIEHWNAKWENWLEWCMCRGCEWADCFSSGMAYFLLVASWLWTVMKFSKCKTNQSACEFRTVTLRCFILVVLNHSDVTGMTLTLQPNKGRSCAWVGRSTGGPDIGKTSS